MAKSKSSLELFHKIKDYEASNDTVYQVARTSLEESFNAIGAFLQSPAFTNKYDSLQQEDYDDFDLLLMEFLGGLIDSTNPEKVAETRIEALEHYREVLKAWSRLEDDE
ncbi:hypothetical protein ACJO11_19605 [Vibrio parahaemolyticus]|uniref:hypothetical protein n=1 Tax=Vibrio parahaemolyticus TaxID=670 RepID=UPI00111CC003|nr:hypothetical protein [Vibrio parahaemolyticus]MBE4743440.1 hypothetical protein [Vibrio parahaemolyticus]MCZ5940095.1 hypothetical protein [Vibrio parahaemolyticus]TOF26554.1 hypothetical protein CGJ27_07605 [Vibrio parahaemolyticus]HAS6767098.1 hypothetical protein [Vibrio parahaemolyticus]HBC3959068.1 hypothetical protein [Vibrio parahaemolyticus]